MSREVAWVRGSEEEEESWLGFELRAWEGSLVVVWVVILLIGNEVMM